MGPDNRGFDSPQIYREDTLIRIQSLEAEIRERAREIEEIQRKLFPGENSVEEEDEECE